MAKKIKWTLKEVRAGDLKPNPYNPKKRDEVGMRRLRKLTNKYGIVFSGIVNKDLQIIDGHSRNELANPDDMVFVFVPDRQLKAEEYKEMNALYDMAKAGNTDTQILEQQFNDQFFEEWEIDKDKDKIVSFKAKTKDPSFKIIVTCDNEQHRKKILERLLTEGLNAASDK